MVTGFDRQSTLIKDMSEPHDQSTSRAMPPTISQHLKFLYVINLDAVEQEDTKNIKNYLSSGFVSQHCYPLVPYLRIELHFP